MLIIVSRMIERDWRRTNLCLTRLPFMVRDSNLIEDPVKLANNIVNLGGQVARVHRHSV